MSKHAPPRSPVTPELELEGNPGSRRQKRGTKRMREFGYKRCEVWLDKTEREIIETYCRRVGKAMSTFMRRLAFETAAAELGKFAEQDKLTAKPRKPAKGRTPVTLKS